MEEKEKKVSKVPFVAAWVVIVALQLAFIVFFFANYKTSYHEDEFFSYSLSNSYYRPFIYGSEHQVSDNYNVWMKGSEFKYYIETNDDTRFKYDSVWYNQTSDVHPPLYYAVLHTISSFFPNQFSWWWGFSINLFCFVISQIFLFKISSTLSKSDFGGLLTCCFWGFSLACQNTQHFVRMYSMLTMFTLMFIYFSMKQFRSAELDIKKVIIPLGLISFGGAMTQHFFLVFAFFYTLFQCVMLFVRKRFKDFFVYGGTVLVGVVLSIAAFPATINHLFSADAQEWYSEIDFWQTFHFLLRVTLVEVFGRDIGIWQSSIMSYILVGVVFVGVPVAGVLWLFRTNPKIKSFFKNLLGEIKATVFEYDLTGIFTILAIAAYYFTLSSKIAFFDILNNIDRYVFPQCALISVLVIAVSFLIIRFVAKLIKFKYVKHILGVVVTGLIGFSLVYQNVKYDDFRQYCYSDKNSNGKIQQILTDKDCLVTVSNSIFLPIFSEMLMNADDIYITLPGGEENYHTKKDEIAKFTNEDEFYLLIFNVLDQDMLIDFVADTTGYSHEEATTEIIHGAKARLLRFYK